MTTQFTIGADPEIFLKNKKGSAVSAHGVIPGTKESPFPCENGAYQVDGLAVEFNIDPTPLTFNYSSSNPDFDSFDKKVVTVMKQMKDKVLEHDKELAFNISPVQEFDAEYLERQPDEAKELGCNPDFNAYTLEPNPRPDASEVLFRTASGHIHVGWGTDIPADHPDHIQICADFIKIMDATVGLYMTIVDRDPRRRELYGKAGAFRPKPYGVEYRTPSNVWLVNKTRRKSVYFFTQLAVTLHTSGYKPAHVGVKDFDEIAEIINTGNYQEAYRVLSRIFKRVHGYEFLRKIFETEYSSRCLFETKGSSAEIIDKILKDKKTKKKTYLDGVLYSPPTLKGMF